ncbi:MAG TPA: hypothetical protein VHG27_03835 [Xanthobacteraceae bacterium]|nr:hypothetical protein [Xanthobacteraceae bacterium]
MKYIAGTILALALVSPAAAAEFWIVQDMSTKRCTIVEQRPTTSTSVTVMGGGKVYTSRTEAESAVKEVCTDGATGSTTTTTTTPSR